MKKPDPSIDPRVSELHAVVPIAEVPSVLEHGILARAGQARLQRASSAAPVPDCRDTRRVPRGLPLCEYASLYFHASNPAVLNRREEEPALCVLRVSAAVLALPGVVITDCDAASDYVRYFSPQQHAALDFDDIYEVEDRAEDSPLRAFQRRLHRCAEVLVPHRVKPGHVAGAYVADAEAASRLAITGLTRPIEVNSCLFNESGSLGNGFRVPYRSDRAFSPPARLGLYGDGPLDCHWHDSWVVLMEVLRNLEAQPHACPVGRTAFHEMGYVLTRVGLPTGFAFTEGAYGPYSGDTRRVIRAFVALGWLKERREGRTLALQVRAQYDRDRRRFSGMIREHREKIARVVDLFSRIRTTEQAVEVASVLFASRQLEQIQPAADLSEEEVLDYVLHWGKKSRSEEETKALATTIRNLVAMGWMNARFSESLRVA